MDKTPTCHIEAKKGDFARTVLMPGDPLRAKFIVDTYLKDAVCVNNVRGVNGYTGTYKGKKVSIMASGMGMPSIGIYSYELYNFYDVENIIRIGTIGSYRDNVKLRDLVIGVGASLDGSYDKQFNLPGHIAPIASYKLLKKADQIGKELKISDKMHFGNVVCHDAFYEDHVTDPEWNKMNCLGCEMESAALYLNAMRAGKHALCICTVCCNMFTGEETSAEDRKTSFRDMMELALNIAVSEEEDNEKK